MKANMIITMSWGEKISSDYKELTQEEVETMKEQFKEGMLDSWRNMVYLDVPVGGQSHIIFTKYIAIIQVMVIE